MKPMSIGIRTALGRLKSKKGQTLVEYALILSFISVLSIIVLTALGVQIQSLYLPIIDALAKVQAAIS
jgi:Flp pilus assembly pilin Flp